MLNISPKYRSATCRHALHGLSTQLKLSPSLCIHFMKKTFYLMDWITFGLDLNYKFQYLNYFNLHSIHHLGDKIILTTKHSQHF